MKQIRRIISLFLIVALLLSMGMLNAFAVDQLTLDIEASKSTVAQGEEVTYSISVKNAGSINIASVGFNLNIPDSLEYVSHTVPYEDKFVQANYNYEAANFTSYGGNINEDDWIVMTVTCKVKAGIAGDITVSFIEDERLVIGDIEDYTPLFEIDDCTITVPKAEASTPVTPTIQSISDTVIEAVQIDGQKYMIKLANEEAPTAESEGWQDSAAFTGLQPNTAYRVYTYIPESDTVAASVIVYTDATTDKTSINDTLVSVTDLTGKVYNGSAQEPTFGGDLEANYDYTISYAVAEGSSGALEAGKPCGAGTYIVTVSGIGDYGGSYTKEFAIAAKNIGTAHIGDIAEFVYDGTPKTPAPIVTDGERLLKETEDYTYSYDDNTYAGTAKVIIHGIGNYQGTQEKTFSITAATQNPAIISDQSLSKGGNDLELNDLVSHVMGNAEVTFHLASGTAATLSGSVLTSDMNATGEVKISVSIAAVDLNADGQNEYDAFEKTDAITVTITDKATAQLPGGVTQQDGVYGETLSDPVYTIPDDTISQTVMYSGTTATGEEYPSTNQKPTEAGAYNVTVTCETSDTIYSASTNFTIVAASIAEQAITLSSNSFTYDGQEKQVTVTGVGSLQSSDYDVSGSLSGTNAGEYTVIVTGKGNYQGTSQVVWHILPKQIEISGATVADREYIQGNRFVTVSDVAFQEANLILDTDYSAIGTMDDDNAGVEKAVTVDVTLTGLAAQNYSLVSNQTTTIVTISKASTENQSAAGAEKYGNMGSVELDAFVVPGGVVEIETVTDTDAILSDVPSVDQEQKTLNFHFADSVDNVGKTATISLKVTSTNYQDYTITVVLTVSDKLTQEIIASNLSCAYGDTGLSIQASAHGALSYVVTTGNDVIEVSDTGAVTIKKVGTATVQISTAGDADYAAASKTVTVEVSKRTIDVNAEDVSMIVGETLPEFSVVYSNIPSNVNIEDIFATLATALTDTDGKKTGSFEIIVTPPTLTDEAAQNYQLGNIENGTLTVNTRPSSGGGGGSGSSSNRPDASVSGEGGSVSASSNGTVTITPDEGYEIASITVNGEEVSIPSNGILTGLDENDEVIVTFAPITEDQPDDSMPFIDVAGGAWYADAVQYMLDNGMMNGTTATTFSPDETTTRAMIVTILHRLENEPSAEASGFTDVAAGSYYADAVNWAAANGIVNGVSETSFAPDDAITREQMAAILYRYAQFKGYDTTVGGMSLSEYADASQISAYATTAMQWANAEGLITGVTNTTLSPQGSATRAQVATILMRFVENIAK